MSMRIYKTVAASSLVALILAIALFVSAAPAKAVGGDCTSRREGNPQVGLDKFRAGAMCYSLQLDSRARAKLNRNGGPDYHSSWFTRLGTWHWSGWYTCYAGCSANVEIGHV